MQPVTKKLYYNPGTGEGRTYKFLTDYYTTKVGSVTVLKDIRQGWESDSPKSNLKFAPNYDYFRYYTTLKMRSGTAHLRYQTWSMRDITPSRYPQLFTFYHVKFIPTVYA